MKLACPTCSTTFEADRKRKYCAAECYPHNQQQTTTLTCKHCGKEHIPNNSRHWYCSAECSNEAKNQRAKKRPPRPEYQKQWHSANKDKIRNYHVERTKREKEARKASPQHTRIYVCTCTETGKPFIARRKDAKYSEEGRLLVKRRNWPQYKKVRTCKCVNCGHPFVPIPGTKRRSICSDACEKRLRQIYKRQRERRIPGPRVTDKVRESIYIRHAYLCVYCGVNTHGIIRGMQHPHEPTIDHVLPVSKGGTNHSHNLQLLCRCCNTSKSDKIEIKKGYGYSDHHDSITPQPQRTRKKGHAMFQTKFLGDKTAK